MRRGCGYIILLLALVSCQKRKSEKPLWLNARKVVVLPVDSLVFRSQGKGWTACLLSFAQPVPLLLKSTETGFIVTSKSSQGVTEGAAELLISNGEQHFFYPVCLRNAAATYLEMDYRSPKTLNPDSSMEQHRMVHAYDSWRNLLFVRGRQAYFYEEIVVPQPKAGTYAAQPDKPLSSFYVQPGSATGIPLRAAYHKEDQAFLVTAGPLRDTHNNTVANGTQVTFLYGDGVTTYQVAAPLQNGYASARIPVDHAQAFSVVAKVHQTTSSTLKLVAP